MTDSQQLLAEYAKSGSEAAFRELLTRYVDLVYSAAVRLVGNDTHLAEDVAQTVFVDLAKKARTLPPEVMLGGWLHRHTCFVAGTLLRGERRRQARERQAVEMNALHQHSDAHLKQVAPILDEAINQLGAEDRTAILLRFFEQLDFRTVGQALGSSEEAAKKRVSRALDKLHHLLAARGVTLSAAALASALAAEAVKAAPTSLVATIAGTALTSAAASNGAAFTILKLMTTSKLALGLAGAALVAGVVFSAKQHQAQVKLRGDNDSLRQQVERLTAEAQGLSLQLAQTNNAQTGANDQLRELMRLRAEVTGLKKQLADTASVRQKSAPGPQPQPAIDSREQQQQMAIGKLRDAKTWTLAFHLFAEDHQKQMPTGFDQVTNYVGTLVKNSDEDGEPLAQLTNQFEIVYQGALNEITNSAGTIVIREKEAWQSADGGWHRTYGFADGHSEIHKAEDGDFGPWEAQHLQKPLVH